MASNAATYRAAITGVDEYKKGVLTSGVYMPVKGLDTHVPKGTINPALLRPAARVIVPSQAPVAQTLTSRASPSGNTSVSNKAVFIPAHVDPAIRDILMGVLPPAPIVPSQDGKCYCRHLLTKARRWW